AKRWRILRYIFDRANIHLFRSSRHPSLRGVAVRLVKILDDGFLSRYANVLHSKIRATMAIEGRRKEGAALICTPNC
mgnify:CR=1